MRQKSLLLPHGTIKFSTWLYTGEELQSELENEGVNLMSYIKEGVTRHHLSSICEADEQLTHCVIYFKRERKTCSFSGRF